MAIKQNFTVFSGNDITLDVELTDEETDTPLQLMGVLELIWSAARRGSNMSPLIEKTLADGITVIDEANGNITIAISAADTEDLEGMFYHELRITNSAGKKITLMHGALEVAINLVRE